MTRGPDGPLRTTSLRRRVTVLVIAVLAVVLVGVVLTVDQVFGVEANRDLGAVLTDHERTALQLARTGATPLQLINRVDSQSVHARLVLTDGQVLGSLDRKAQDNPASKQSTITLRSAGQLNGARLTIVVEAAVITNAQNQLRRTLLLVGLVALLVTAVVLVLTVRLALKPLEVMANLSRTITRGGRGRRLSPTRTDTEIGRSAEAFDEMLDALEGAEHQARVAEAASRASEERTRRFVADAAHELRTPIAGVQAAAEAVLQQPPDAPKEDRDRMHLLLVRESHRAGQLVNDLLDLARIDAGVELHRSPVDLRDLAQTQADRCRLLAPGLTVEVQGPPLVVSVDPARITQIVANLLDNARHATPADGRVAVWLRRSGGFAELIVADSGGGVPAADRERIFDRLVRLDTARDRRSGGSGLGLPIARGFARAHGGDLTCEAPPPGRSGAVFRLLLPVADDPRADTVRIGLPGAAASAAGPTAAGPPVAILPEPAWPAADPERGPRPSPA